METEYYYLCKLMYVGDRSSHSANIPDQCAEQVILQSDINLEDIPIYKIKDYYDIKELLEQNDCETIQIEPLTIEEYTDEHNGYLGMDVYFIDSKLL